MENKNTPRKGCKNGMETLKQRRRNGYKDRKGRKKVHGNTKTNKEK